MQDFAAETGTDISMGVLDSALSCHADKAREMSNCVACNDETMWSSSGCTVCAGCENDKGYFKAVGCGKRCVSDDHILQMLSSPDPTAASGLQPLSNSSADAAVSSNGVTCVQVKDLTQTSNCKTCACPNGLSR